jgi:hypothetical protein
MEGRQIRDLPRLNFATSLGFRFPFLQKITDKLRNNSPEWPAYRREGAFRYTGAFSPSTFAETVTRYAIIERMKILDISKPISQGSR